MRAGSTRPAIARIWRGRVRRDRADEYERYNHEAGIKPRIDLARDPEFLIELPDQVQILAIRASHGDTGGEP